MRLSPISLRHTLHKARCGAPCATSPASLRQIPAPLCRPPTSLRVPAISLLPPPHIAQGALRRALCYISSLPPPDSSSPPPASYLPPPSSWLPPPASYLSPPASYLLPPASYLPPNSLRTIPCVRFPAYGSSAMVFSRFQDFRPATSSKRPPEPKITHPNGLQNLKSHIQTAPRT